MADDKNAAKDAETKKGGASGSSTQNDDAARKAAEKAEADRAAQAGSERQSDAEQERAAQAEARRVADAKSRGERIDQDVRRQKGVESAGAGPRGGVRVVNRTGEVIRVITERRSTDQANPGFERDTLLTIQPDDQTEVSVEENSRVVIDII